MQVEIIEFYPMYRNKSKQRIAGTVRVKLPEMGIYLSGVFVSKKRDNWYVSLPEKKGICHKTGKQIAYTTVYFEDYQKQCNLKTQLKKIVREFIENRLLDTENPIVFLKDD